MKSRQRTLRLAMMAMAGGGTLLPLHAQHGHLNAGAAGTAQGDPLNFANGAAFAASSGYVKDLTFAPSGTYAGYYEGGITLTALPQTIANGGPAAGAPALGSFIQYSIVSVQGPAGGHFGFWEEGATSPTFSYATGAAIPGDRIALSDASLGAGSAGADPYGHLHGRRFTVDKPGTYTVGFRLFDTSANGAGGGPIHGASETLQISFQSVGGVPEPSSLALLGSGLAMAGVAWHRGRRRNISEGTRQ